MACSQPTNWIDSQQDRIIVMIWNVFVTFCDNIRIVIMKEGRQLVSQKKRESTDLICLILFTFLTIVMLIASIYSSIKGSTSKYSSPYDPDGKGCGTDYPDYKFIYFPSPQVDSMWVTTCVKTCPSEGDTSVDCKVNSVVGSCLENNSADNTKAFHIYGTQAFRGSICLPAAETIKDRVLGAVSAHFLEEMFGSVLKDWTLLLLIILVAAVAALLAVLMIRIIAGYVIYIFYAIIILALIIFGVYLVIPVQNADQSTFILKQNAGLAIAISVICFILAIAMLFLFISYRDKIRQTVEYIDKSNEFFKNNYSILLLPVILSGCTLAFLGFWLFLTLSFFSLAEPVHELNQLPFQHYKMSAYIIVALIISIFYLIWALFLLMHTGKCILSGTLIMWRFNRSDPYLKSSKTFFSSHIGSTCLSSFLTVVFGLFKFQVDQVQPQPSEQDRNRCTSFFSKCFSCVCCCCINFVFTCFHHAGFSYLNLSGLPYCQSSAEVHELIKQQRPAWSVVALLYSIYNDFIPLLFAIGNMLFANFLVDTMETYNNKTANRLLLLGVVALLTYTTTQFYLAIYSETVQTSFVLEQFYARMPNKDKYPLIVPEEKKNKEKEADRKSQRFAPLPENKLT